MHTTSAPTRPRRLVLGSLVLFVALLLGACGDDDDSVESGASGDDTTTVADDGSGDDGATGSDGDTGSDDASGTCLEGTTDCDDTPVSDDGSGDDDVVCVEAPCDDAAAPIEPTGDALNPIPTAIVGHTASADGTSLDVTFYMGVEECNRLDRVEVEETDTTVTITIFTGANPDAAGVACIEIAELRSTTVELDAPLGDRTVVDGSL
jgi:hypothetical protein